MYLFMCLFIYLFMFICFSIQIHAYHMSVLSKVYQCFIHIHKSTCMHYITFHYILFHSFHYVNKTYVCIYIYM